MRDKFVWIFALAADRELTESARLVGVIIALRNVDPGTLTFRVRQVTVAENTGMSVESVKRAFKVLRRRGYICLVSERRRGRGQHGANQYRLTTPQIGVNLTPNTEEIGVSGDGNRCQNSIEIGVSTDAVTSGNYDLKGIYKGLRKGTAPSAATPDPSADEEPNPYCARHPGGTTAPCTDCQRHREAHRLWDERQQEKRRIAGRDRAAAIADCRLCDDYGWLLGDDGSIDDRNIVCPHRTPARNHPDPERASA